jgi:hypothetical protein
MARPTIKVGMSLPKNRRVMTRAYQVTLYYRDATANRKGVPIPRMEKRTAEERANIARDMK